MRKTVLFACTLLLVQFLNGQATGFANENEETTATLKEQIDSLLLKVNILSNNFEITQNQGEQFENRLRLLQSTVAGLNLQIDSLEDKSSEQFNKIEKLEGRLQEKGNELDFRITETQQSSQNLFTELDENLSRNTLYWIIAVLVLAVLVLVIFMFLTKKLKTNQANVFDKLTGTRKELEQEGLRLDGKLIQVMETQLQLMKKEPAQEKDHSLALKVADEIVRIEKNISQMDEGTRGLKQLSKAIERIKDNFAANEYEMVPLIGKKYDDGMKLAANFIPDDNLKPGERIITRIIKPQINFKNEMIQSAQVEVSQG